MAVACVRHGDVVQKDNTATRKLRLSKKKTAGNYLEASGWMNHQRKRQPGKGA